MSKAAIIAILLCLLGASAHAGESRSDVCPAGFSGSFNVNKVGCTLCVSNAPECENSVQCLGPPTCFCPPGDKACCDATPCCFNCPGEGSLNCNVSSCQCTPESCCSLVCPDAVAPVSSTPGLAALAAVLLAVGIGATRFARRRR